MKLNTLTAVAITATVGIATLALSNTARADTTSTTFINAFGSPVQFVLTNRNTAEHPDRKILRVAISAALKKYATLSPGQKKKAGCPQVHVNLNPGAISKTVFFVVLRQVRPAVKPKYKKFTPAFVDVRWMYHGTLERLCVSYQGRGHHSENQTWDGWKSNFNPTPKLTTALYVQ